jgi:general secretion pathway protein G
MQYKSRPRSHNQSGLTLVELIVTVAILAILASAAVPLARFRAQRERERELRYDLWQMRDAIDRYKDAAPTVTPSRPSLTATTIRRISIRW